MLRKMKTIAEVPLHENKTFVQLERRGERLARQRHLSGALRSGSFYFSAGSGGIRLEIFVE